MSYASYAAGIGRESPFKLYSQLSFSSDFKLGQPSQRDLSLQQHHQQQHQRQHLQQQLQQKLMHHAQQPSSSQPQLYSVAWSMVWCAVLVTAVVAALFAFAPLQTPSQRWSAQLPQEQAMAPTAGTIRCHVQHGADAVDSLCDGQVTYQGGVQQHITVWRHASMTGAADAGVAAAGLTDVASSSSWATAYGRHRRHQHRKLVRLV